MSVRAHRVIKIETAGDSFNMSHETKLMDFIISNSHNDIESKLDESGCGLFEVPVIVLKQAINKIPIIDNIEREFEDEGGMEPEFANLNLDDYVIKSLKEDIEFAEKNGDDYVMYYAY